MVEDLATGAQLTMLYVEDDQITREAVCTMVGRRFPELVIHTASNGAEGFQCFLDLGPDMVVTDIRMPHMNGIEMSRRIIALGRATPIIVTSAHADMDYFIESIEIGISRYVMKPVDKDQLFEAIEGTLAALRLETERKLAAAEIVSLNRHLSARASELEIANRDLEAFSYTVSHDLRTPLTNINGFCQVILELFGAGLDDQCREFIKIILSETIAMNDLIKTLLDFSKVTRQEISRAKADLSEMASTAAATLLMHEPQRAINFNIAPGIAVEGDPDLLRVVLVNLLGNACKYTGGKKESRIEFGVAESAVERAYFVRDNGAGFDMAQADRLFSPFQRLHSDRDFKGFGIGLATVHRIIQRHGGRVWAEGADGQGATFFFTLPQSAIAQ